MTWIKTRAVPLLAMVAMLLGIGAVVATPAQATVCSPVCYDYAGFRQTVDIDGVAVLIGKDTPAIDSKAYHSLAELDVKDSTGNNAVEVGWTDEASVCGAGVSICLFIFWWKNGVPQCYNGCGAVNGVGCSPYCMGASLDGIANGTSKNFALQHINGYWWAGFDGAWRFAIPDTAWGVYAFTRASKFEVFGEVAESDTTTCANMGAGVMPTGSPTYLGGKMNSMTLVNGSAALAPTAFATQPTRWNALMVTASSGRYGGDGGC